MATSPHFHLVDSAGNPLDERYHTAAGQLEREFFEAFPRIDPVDVCNAVEESAQKTALYERNHGRVENLKPFLLRVFVNTMKSLLRNGYHALREKPLSAEELQELAVFAHEGNPEQIEIRILAKTALMGLDKEKRELLAARAIGYSGEELARRFNITENHVYVLLHRARQKARAVLLSRSGIVESSHFQGK
jgi:RNA polymerase sigma factor (sigma-70 family)